MSDVDMKEEYCEDGWEEDDIPDPSPASDDVIIKIEVPMEDVPVEGNSLAGSSRKKPDKRTKGLSTHQRIMRRKEQQKAYSKRHGRVYIRHEQYKRWLQVRDREGVKSDTDLVKLLLDKFERPTSPLLAISTPIKLPAHEMVSPARNVDASDEAGGFQPEALDMPSTSEEVTTSSVHMDIRVEYAQRGDFIYPVESESENSDSSWDVSAWEEERSWSDVSEELNQNHPEGISHLTNDDIFEVEEASGSDVASEDENAGPSELNVDDIVSDQTCIAYSRSLLQILAEIPLAKCNTKACLSVPKIKHKMIGTALCFRWECENGHVSKKWNSQPRVRRDFAADIGLSAAILFSGNNYAKIKMLFSCLNLGICSSNLHFHVQRNYTCPVINAYWTGLQREILDARRGHEVVVSGDGRNDSPGLSAQYCSYTTMDYSTGDILHVAVVDKRQVAMKSPNMEKYALVESLKLLQDNHLKVTEIVTDSHPSIRAYLKQHPDVYHSSDVWHGAKNIGKKLAEVSKKAANRSLLQWTGDVTRHFWYCCSQANGDRMRLLSRWKGLLHHVVGRHEWASGDGGGPAKCEHAPLPESSKMKTLPEGSPAHIALREIVLDQRLINNIGCYTRFRHTGPLENFQSHILAYASKRFAYSYPSYKARNLLAAIDYQKHKDRKQKVKKDGTPMFRRHFHKGSERWGVVPVKEEKTYEYICELMKEVYRKRIQDPSTQRYAVVLGEDDPRRIAATIAPSQPPSTEELVMAHKSRF